jgi:hypothetical protein
MRRIWNTADKFELDDGKGLNDQVPILIQEILCNSFIGDNRPDGFQIILKVAA